MGEAVALSGSDLLWNWSRWCWIGPTVGNMIVPVPWDDEKAPPVNVEHACIVQALYDRLPHVHRMVILAEYPQRNRRFPRKTASERCTLAREWIRKESGVTLTASHYDAIVRGFERMVEGAIE